MKTFAIATIAAIMAASPATAATIIQSGAINSAAPTTSVIGVQQFDPTLGTLNSITLLFSSSLTASGSISNASNIPWLFLLGTGGTATLSGGGFNIAETPGASLQLVFVPKKGSTNIGPFSGSASSSSTLTSGFAPFLGTGTTALNFASTSLFNTFPSSGKLNISPLIGGAYTLTYDYTAAVAAVPEPATWALMLVGIGMVGGSMRRRHRKTAVSTTVSFA